MKRLRNAGIYYIIFGLFLMVSYVFTNLWPIAILGVLMLLIYYIVEYGFKKKPISLRITSTIKRLRNTGIYYIIFGLFLMVYYTYNNLWPIALLVLGGIVLITYYVLKYGFKKKRINPHATKTQLVVLDTFLVLFPFIYVTLVLWYIWRPYKQAIVLPDQYEGIVVVQYDRPEGQAKKWIGGFLGIGGSRLIEVDSTGMAKAQFKYHNNGIPFLGLKKNLYNKGGMQIYYKNDVHHEIITGANGQSMTYENNNNHLPSIYFTRYRKYPLIIFVITKKENYHHFFLSAEECKEMYDKYPDHPSNFSCFNYLNTTYSHYYDVYDYYSTKK